MSTNLFTAEQEAFLRNNGIDTSQPVFPLSCRIAAKTMEFQDIIDNYSNALVKKISGGYESEEEHKKKYLKQLIFGGGYHFHIILFIVLALILGTILGLVVRHSIGLRLADFVLTEEELALSRVIRNVCIVLTFIILNAGSLFGYLSKNRENIDMEMKQFRSEVSHYHETMKDYEENNDTNSEKLKMFRDIMKIISADREAIPEKYWEWGSLFLSYYNDRKANNVSEAIRVFEEEQHRYRVESEMERQTQLANQANIAAQEALQTARSAQASASVAVGIANSNDYHPQNRY